MKGTLAVIPARSGSKGIPHKNMRRLMDIPLVEWSIKTCMESDVDHIAVSTDDKRVAEVARDYNVSVVNRPESLATDTAASEWAIVHAINTIRWRGENTLMVQCTSPLTLAEDINGVIEMLDDHDCVFTAVRFHGFIWDADLRPVNHNLKVRQMRQERMEYVENGAVYGFKTGLFMKNKNRFFGKKGIYEMPEERGLEIDHPYHLVLAESIMKKKIHTNSPQVRSM